MGLMDQPRKFTGAGGKIPTSRIRKLFEEHEKNTAEALGGKTVPGSGSSIHAKSDVVMDKFRVECKETSKQSMSLKLLWLEKITIEATDTNRIPLMAIRFEEAQVAEKDWIMVPREVFKELIDE